MKNIRIFSLLFIGFLALTLSSCDKDETDKASSIVGVYKMDTYTTHSGTSTPNVNDKMVIEKVDDDHVKVTIDYAQESATDVTFSNMSITKASDVYSFEQEFTNAEASGTVTDNKMTFDVTYTSGDYANITASK